MTALKPIAATLLGLAILSLAGAAMTQLRWHLKPPAETASLNVDGGVTTLTVDSPRPLATAVQALVGRDGVLITYEDPPFTYSGDLQDVTWEFAKGLAKYVPGTIIVPMGGKLTVRVPSTEVSVILGQLVQLQSEGKTGGRFRVEQTANAFHVVPAASRDRDGNWVSTGSILDVPISLPTQERTGAELIGAICAAVGSAAHVEVSDNFGLGMGLVSVAGPPQYRFGANNELARSVLMRALAAIATERGRMSWLLFRDPEKSTYVLNGLAVPDKSTRVAVPVTTTPVINEAATPNHGIGAR